MTRCVRLAWDSEHFGLPIGRVDETALDPAGAAAALAWAHAEGVRCLTFLARADDDATVRAVEAAGFHQTDVRVTLERHGRAAEPPPRAAEITLRGVLAGEVAELRRLAASHHRLARFYYDGHLPAERCDALYAAWIENSLHGFADRVIVAEHGGALAGYLTWKTTAEVGSIGLVGVADAARGLGLGAALVHAAIELSAAAGDRRLEVVTQARNVASQRLYQRAGFVTQKTELWYHAWI